MYVPKSLKLNRFTVVDIPSPKEIFTRFGFATGTAYSGDEEVPSPMSKVDMMIHFDMLNGRHLDSEEAAAAAAAKLDPTK